MSHGYTIEIDGKYLAYKDDKWVLVDSPLDHGRVFWTGIDTKPGDVENSVGTKITLIQV